VAELIESHRTCVFRIVQEALTNCARHAKATEVQIAIEAGEESVNLTISDNGKGFDAATPHRGLGLFSMRERSAELGGAFEIQSKPGQGTCIRVTIPVKTPVTG